MGNNHTSKHSIICQTWRGICLAKTTWRTMPGVIHFVAINLLSLGIHGWYFVFLFSLTEIRSICKETRLCFSFVIPWPAWVWLNCDMEDLWLRSGQKYFSISMKTSANCYKQDFSFTATIFLFLCFAFLALMSASIDYKHLICAVM